LEICEYGRRQEKKELRISASFGDFRGAGGLAMWILSSRRAAGSTNGLAATAAMKTESRKRERGKTRKAMAGFSFLFRVFRLSYYCSFDFFVCCEDILCRH